MPNEETPYVKNMRRAHISVVAASRSLYACAHAVNATEEERAEALQLLGAIDTAKLAIAIARGQSHAKFPQELGDEVAHALAGDSNDAEHDALYSVAEHFGIEVSEGD